MLAPLLSLFAATALLQLEPIGPPVAKRIPHVVEFHGEKLVDNYQWLREKGSKDVLDFLNGENRFADSEMLVHSALQETLYKEMLGRIQQTDLSVPYRKGDYWYYTRTEEGKQYPVYCRKKGENGADETLLDVNELAKGEKFMSVGNFQVSDDGSMLAYATDSTGFRQYRLHVKDLRSGKPLPDTAERITAIQWAADNNTLFFGTEDEITKRSDKIFRMTLGGKPELIYEEKDALYNCGIGKTLDRKFLLIESGCAENNETWFLDASKPTGKFKLIEKRQGELEYDVAHRDGTFYIRTNKNAKDFEVMTTAVRRPGKKSWKPLINPIPKGTIGGMAVFKNHLVISKRENGLDGLAVVELLTGKSRDVPAPEKLFSLGFATNAEFDTDQFRYSFSSPVTPSSIYELDLGTFGTKLLKKTPVLGGYDASKYETERVFATAPDGASIPIGLTYRKDMKKVSGNPLLLDGYGAYGASAGFGFSNNEVSLLDRGIVLASAQIRGGSDMGIAWHDQGKMMFKRNTFTDFAACADHLVYEGWTSRDRMAIVGGSAGGLLIGATLNIRPDLCKAAILYVPFIDVINTMADEALPLTVAEFLEWGNPKKESEYRYIRTYSPYENIRTCAYPDLLVKTSYNDSQVMYWEPAKYVAKMREIGKPSSLIFKTNMAGGHGGSSGRFDALRERAFDYAWLLVKLGIEK